MAVPERHRAGGRSEQVRLAVGAAVLGLLSDGRVDVTVAQVAELAAVTRGTVYRWWPTREALLIEAVGQHVHRLEVPRTGRWAGDLRTFAHRVARFAADPVELAMARAIATGEHPDLARIVTEQYEPIMHGWRSILVRAAESGRIDSRHDPHLVIDLLAAPLFLGPLMTGRPVATPRVDRIVDLAIDSLTAPRQPPGR